MKAVRSSDSLAHYQFLNSRQGLSRNSISYLQFTQARVSIQRTPSLVPTSISFSTLRWQIVFLAIPIAIVRIIRISLAYNLNFNLDLDLTRTLAILTVLTIFHSLVIATTSSSSKQALQILQP
jgi:hypothetical protein